MVREAVLYNKEEIVKIIVSNSAQEPIYEQVCKQVKAQIISGELKEGDNLPSIRNLAKELQISVITTKRSYEELEKEGFIDTVVGKGSFVAMQNKDLLREKKMKSVEEMLTDAVNEAQKLGVTLKELREILTILYTERD